MKLKHKKNYTVVVIILIIILTFEWINIIGKIVNDNFVFYIKQNVKKEINHYLFYSFSSDVAKKFKVEDIISLNLNKKGEIMSVDYKMDNIYVLLSDSLEILYNNINNISFNINYKEDKNKVLWIPLGVGKRNILISNFGPKIPIKINVLTDSKMGYKTQVKNYGINNVLLELYLEVKVYNTLLTPVSSQDFDDEYSILIASRIVPGSVPDYYNGVLENTSPLVDS